MEYNKCRYPWFGTSARDTDKRRRYEVQFEKKQLQCEAEAVEAQVLKMAEGLQVLEEAAATGSENKIERTSEYVICHMIVEYSEANQ